MMNVERMKEVAERIGKLKHTPFDWDTFTKADPEGFNMVRYNDSCGSPCCIAGWVCHWYGLESDREGHGLAAADFLGLDDYQAMILFDPNESRFLQSITPREAQVAILRLAADPECSDKEMWG